MSDSWERFCCKLPLEAYRLLEDELDRIKLLADIDPDERLSQEVRDGLCIELMCANSRDIMDEEVE